LTITLADCPKKIFICPHSKKELAAKEKIGTLAYIQWAEQQQVKLKQQVTQKKCWPQVPSVQKNRPEWYCLPTLPFADIFCNRFFDRRFFFSLPKDQILEDQTFYGLLLNDKYQRDKELIFALLNSTLTYYFLEIFGRTSLGKGALQYTISDYSTLPIIDPKTIPSAIVESVVTNFRSIANRPIKTIFEELKQDDRKNMDSILFDWLGVTKEEREAIYQSLTLLVKKRLQKSGQKV
jgi:hypothetical protein